MKKLLLLLCIFGFFSSAFAKQKEEFNDFLKEIIDVYSIMMVTSEFGKNFDAKGLLLYEKGLADAIIINSVFYDKKDKAYSLMYTKKLENGMTPLMLASLFGFPNVVDALLLTSDDKSRDLRTLDNNGLNAYEIAGLAINQTYISCELAKFIKNPLSFKSKIKLREFYYDQENPFFGNYKKILVSMQYYGMKFDNRKSIENFNNHCSIDPIFAQALYKSENSFDFMVNLNETFVKEIVLK